MKYNVLKASQNQTREIAKVLRLSYRDTYPDFPVLHTPEEDLDFIENKIFKTDKVFIAKNLETNEVLGFIAFNDEFLDLLYLLPEAQNIGVGSALLAYAKRESHSLKLWTFQQNSQARNFYKKHGFVEIKMTDGLENEEKQPDVLMKWESESSSFKLQAAINNSMGWYKSVFKANSLELKKSKEIFYSFEKSPPLFSNLATREESWSPDEIFKRIDSSFATKKWDEWSIKDSFSKLDLTEHGFSKLFDAQWVYLSFDESNRIKNSPKYSFKVVNSEQDLDSWIELWGEGTELGGQIFSKNLLNDPNIELITYECEDNKGVASLNRDGFTVGITNFFPSIDQQSVWSELISYIMDRFGRVDIVGYEVSDSISLLEKLGYQPVGDMRVWLKKPSLNK